MKSAILQKIPHERFNELQEGYTLDRFSWFEIMPCRVQKTDDTIVQCKAEQAEFWTIYGRENVETNDEPEYHALAVHDDTKVREIVRIAHQIALETSKGFVVGCAERGQFPKKKGKVTPVNDFTKIAQDITLLVLKEVGREGETYEKRIDDFDNHPLSELLAAFVDYSDYYGSGPLDPYQEVAA